MKTFYNSIIVFFCFFIGSNVQSQNLFNVEIYGGYNKNYFQTGDPTTNPDLRFSSPLGLHAGLNFLPKIGRNWQMSVQAEWMQSAIRLENGNLNSGKRTNSYGNYALGARYNLERNTHSFYFQPAFGISVNNYLDPMEGVFGVYGRRDIHLVARAEAGVKIYNKNSNYLLFGLRHQQGFISGSPYGGEHWTDIPISSNASYTGLFMGYGINTDNWYKAKRNRKLTPQPEMVNPWTDGIYVMGTASPRLANHPENSLTDDYQKFSTSYMLGLGYRYGDFSVEGGFAGFRGRNVYEILSPDDISVSISHRKFSVSTIPVTLRYDRQLPISKSVRLGASFTTHIPVGFQNSGQNVTSAAGSRIINGVTIPYESQRTGLDANPKGVFFNSGIYTEMPLFRTGMITFLVSRNFGSPAFDLVQVDYQVGGVPGSLESKGNLNGWVLEVAYRLPLNNIF